MTTRIVRPFRAERREIRCNFADVAAAGLAVPTVFFFERRLDVDALARGLREALERAPIFAGRLQRRGSTLHIRCEGQGVPMSTAASTSTSEEAMRELSRGGGQWLVDMLTPRRATRGRDSLLTVRVTHLADGTSAVGCCFHHAVGDMHTFLLFMKIWAASAASEPPPDAEVVDDRVAYIFEHMPPDATHSSHLKLLGARELFRFGLFLTLAPRKSRALMIYFGEDEIERMRAAYASAGERLSANDAVCAHILSLIAACDEGIEAREATLAINLRPRCGLDEALMGNFIGTLPVDVRADDAPRAIAGRIRRGVDHFASESLDFRATQAYADALGPRALSPRCAAASLDRLNSHGPIISNWTKFGAYDVKFEGARPTLFAVIWGATIPWFNIIHEGFENRGLLVSTVLPDRVAGRLMSPPVHHRLHAFREPEDDLPAAAPALAESSR